MHFNRMINNIEIWLQTESQPAIVTIKPKHLQSIHMKKWVFLSWNSLRYSISMHIQWKRSLFSLLNLLIEIIFSPEIPL